MIRDQQNIIELKSEKKDLMTYTKFIYCSCDYHFKGQENIVLWYITIFKKLYGKCPEVHTPKFLTKQHVQTEQTQIRLGAAVLSGSTLFVIPLSIFGNNSVKAKFRPKNYGKKCSKFYDIYRKQ